MRSSRRNALVVLGMHRSGTSALAGVLSLIGVDFASKSKHFDANANVNAKGYWEHAGLVMQNEKALSILDSSWDSFKDIPEGLLSQQKIYDIEMEIKKILRDDFENAPLLGIKDPRICKLIPLWLRIFSDLNITPHFAIIFRHPYEVEESLVLRDKMAREKANLLWLSYVLTAEKYTRGYTRSFLSYEGLLSDWSTSTEHIIKKIDPHLKISHKKNNEIEAFLSLKLRHSNISNDLLSEGDNGEWLELTYQSLKQLAKDPSDIVAIKHFDMVRNNFLYGSKLFSPLIFREGSNEEELLKLHHKYTVTIDAYNQVRNTYELNLKELNAIKSSFMLKVVGRINRASEKIRNSLFNKSNYNH